MPLARRKAMIKQYKSALEVWHEFYEESKCRFGELGPLLLLVDEEFARVTERLVKMESQLPSDSITGLNLRLEKFDATDAY